MATITSNIGVANGDVVIDGSEAIYTIKGKGETRGHGIIAYIDYTKAGGDLLNIKTYFKNNQVDINNFYQLIVVDAFLLKQLNIDVTASGKYRIPLSAALCDEYVKIDFTGLDTGIINVEFAQDYGYF